MRRWFVGGTLVLVAALLLSTRDRPSEDAPEPAAVAEAPAASDSDDRARARVRAMAIATLRKDLSLEQAELSVAESDLLVTRLRRKGVEDVAEHVQLRLAQVSPTEEQLHLYYEQHRTLFGRRSFEESRPAVDRLVRIQLVREELGVVGVVR